MLLPEVRPLNVQLSTNGGVTPGSLTQARGPARVYQPQSFFSGNNERLRLLGSLAIALNNAIN